MQAISPTLSRDPEAILILASTPAGKSSAFYKTWEQAQADPAWHAQATTIEDAIQAGLKVDLDSLHTLCPDQEAF